MIATLLCLSVLNMIIGCAGAQTDILEELQQAVSQASAADARTELIKAIDTLGYPADPDAQDDVAGNLYDAMMDICEKEYGDYYGWNLHVRHRFDALMVSLGELPYCINLDPAADILAQEAALEMAIAEIAARYGEAYRMQAYDVAVSYCAADAGDTKGMWRFGLAFADGELYSACVLDGKVTHCTRENRIGSLEAEYTVLCDSRGAFFRWSVQEKAEYADSLPAKLHMAQAKNETNRSYEELAAIARYGFCIPEMEDLPQEEARRIALKAVQEKYCLPDGWHGGAEVFYSFFTKQTGESVWRVIIWNTGNAVFPGGVAELDAGNGFVLKVEKNGTTPGTFIPYLDRI